MVKHINPVADIKNLHAVCERLIFFSKGLDLDNSFPKNDIIKQFDLFFVHGPVDEARLKMASYKPVFRMGYPRYASKLEVRNKKIKNLFKSFYNK